MGVSLDGVCMGKPKLGAGCVVGQEAGLCHNESQVEEWLWLEIEFYHLVADRFLNIKRRATATHKKREAKARIQQALGIYSRIISSLLFFWCDFVNVA
jgi:hypothetical protein